jgi:GPI mannosyltransferase 3
LLKIRDIAYHEDSTNLWKWLPAVLAAGLMLRLAIAVYSVRIGQFDEVFQYLEQAHRLVYGYGYVPWEYRFGVRNWLLPATLAGTLEILRLVHIDRPTLYIPVINGIFATLSLCVVWSSYAISRNYFAEQAARFSAVVAAIWYHLLYASVMATPEVLGAYAILAGFAVATMDHSVRRVAAVGLLLGAGVALRLQYALPAAVLWVWLVNRWGRRCVISLTAWCAAVPIFAGLLDYVFWGTPFISVYNYFLFNFVYGLSNDFGLTPPLWYFSRLTVLSAGLFPLAVAYGIITWRRSWVILLLIGSILIPHSFVAHKEIRFVFLAIPLLLLLLADLAVNGVPRLLSFLNRSHAQALAGASVCIVSLLGCVVGGVFNRDDHLVAILDLSRQNDVKAVLDLTGAWYKSGGFYYLHRDVPYFDVNMVKDPADYHLFASHIIAPKARGTVPGYIIAATYGDVEVLKQTSPPSQYRRIENYRDPPWPGIDDRFVPRVRSLIPGLIRGTQINGIDLAE